ncbi:MAG: hypothetical protein GXP49_05555 [Deltaproteobacteria bacterium]|nr:hypothetical protein [Deltaproteobacteria bacterium]
MPADGWRILPGLKLAKYPGPGNYTLEFVYVNGKDLFSAKKAFGAPGRQRLGKDQVLLGTVRASCSVRF